MNRNRSLLATLIDRNCFATQFWFAHEVIFPAALTISAPWTEP